MQRFLRLAFLLAALLAAGALRAQQPAMPSPGWVARRLAEVQVLDKVNARAVVLRISVGDSARQGDLTIAVAACFVRPPDQAPDATAYLSITDRQGSGAFRGWMFAASPMRNMLEHPIYDVRILDCRG